MLRRLCGVSFSPLSALLASRARRSLCCVRGTPSSAWFSVMFAIVEVVRVVPVGGVDVCEFTIPVAGATGTRCVLVVACTGVLVLLVVIIVLVVARATHLLSFCEVVASVIVVAGTVCVFFPRSTVVFIVAVCVLFRFVVFGVRIILHAVATTVCVRICVGCLVVVFSATAYAQAIGLFPGLWCVVCVSVAVSFLCCGINIGDGISVFGSSLNSDLPSDVGLWLVFGVAFVRGFMFSCVLFLGVGLFVVSVPLVMFSWSSL